MGFKTTVEAGLIQVNFIDKELNLTYKAYMILRKPNLDILYVSSQLNHQRQIVKLLIND